MTGLPPVCIRKRRQRRRREQRREREERRRRGEATRSAHSIRQATARPLFAQQQANDSNTTRGKRNAIDE